MRRIVCSECKKHYDFDKDDFCPRCGAFHPPAKTLTVDNFGRVVRVDGINERNHAGSFVHKEVHKEKAQRRMVGMDRDVIKPTSRKPAAKKKSDTMNPKVRYILEKFLAYIVAMAVLGYLFSLLFDSFIWW